MSLDFFASTAVRGGKLGQINAGVKLASTLVMTLALLLVKDWVSAGSILVLEMVALGALGVNPVRLLGRFWPVVFAAFLSGWSTSLLAEKTGAIIFELGFLVVTVDSLLTGFALTLRGLATVLPGLVLVAATDPTDIADSLAQTVRLPERFVLAALAALRLVGLMVHEWYILGQARRARGLGDHDSPWQRLKTAGGQTFALLVQAIRRGSRLAVTMEARGFGAVHKRTWARTPTYSRADLWFVLGCLAVILTGYLLALGTGSLTFLWQ